MSLDHSGWIQLCSSEGAFEYGSDSDIIENLDRFFENSQRMPG